MIVARRSLTGPVFAVALGGLLTLVALVAYGGHAAYLTAVLLTPLGVLSAFAADALARHRDRAGGLRRQFAVVALAAVLQFGVAVALFAGLMFVSAHDAFFTALLVFYATAVAGWTARLIGREALADVDAIRATLTAVGDGRRDTRTGIAGRDELAALAADVDAMVDRLAAEEEARATLIAAVSHDLRTPITSLRLLADAIDDDLVDAPTRREYAARMSTHVTALSALIDDLFELTRLQSGDLRWTIEQVRMDHLVAEAVEAMRPVAGTIRVDVDAAMDLRAPGNPEKLQRVLFNLIQNAIRHTPPDGTITVRATEGPTEVEVEVADTGTGIAEGDRARIFEPFFRGDRARTDAGAGLGLAICTAIVEAHGGRIWLAEADAGTSVRFALPRG